MNKLATFLMVFLLILSIGCHQNVNEQNGDNPGIGNSGITNGDFLNHASGTDYPDNWIAGSWDKPESYLSSYDGKNGVVSFTRTSGNAGLDMKQTLSTPFIVTDSSKFGICFKIVSQILGGDGTSGTESPIVFQLLFVKSGSPNLVITRYYNTTNDADSASNPSFELVASNAWVTKNYNITVDFGVPAGYGLSSIRLGGNGWEHVSYVDYVNIN
jgi:hypothetical protein